MFGKNRKLKQEIAGVLVAAVMPRFAPAPAATEKRWNLRRGNGSTPPNTPI
jgi:hypothetical protein